VRHRSVGARCGVGTECVQGDVPRPAPGFDALTPIDRLEALPREAGKAQCAGLTARQRTRRGRAFSPRNGSSAEGSLSFRPGIPEEELHQLELNLQEKDHAVN